MHRRRAGVEDLEEADAGPLVINRTTPASAVPEAGATRLGRGRGRRRDTRRLHRVARVLGVADGSLTGAVGTRTNDGVERLAVARRPQAGAGAARSGGRGHAVRARIAGADFVASRQDSFAAGVRAGRCPLARLAIATRAAEVVHLEPVIARLHPRPLARAEAGDGRRGVLALRRHLVARVDAGRRWRGTGTTRSTVTRRSHPARASDAIPDA
jgi:hypothetical protein